MKIKHCLALVTTMAALSFCCRVSAQTTFYFQFNDDPGRLEGTPIVGTGTFTFANDPGDGLFPFLDLGKFKMDFTFDDGQTYLGVDIASHLKDTLVLLTGSGPTRRLRFAGDGAGVVGGSIDFYNGSDFLSFAPSGTGTGLQLYVEGIAGAANFGDYLATAAPNAGVPDGGSTFWMAGFGCLALMLAGRHAPKLAPARRA
ncbi:MAG TPA: hypothetical protein VGO59_09415 [Verrucomicrobiae bacterium]|jgi:hypothetical protein